MLCKKCTSLREKKFAKRKLEIVNSFLEKLKVSRLEDISIKDVCSELYISEGTFYNYFPKKSDLLEYYISVWSIYANYCANKMADESSIKAIEEVFHCTAEMMQGKTAVMAEIIAHIARNRKIPDIKDLSVAEKLIAYPKEKDIEKIKATDLKGLFSPLIEKAVKQGELAQDVNVDDLVIILKGIFFGAVIAINRVNTEKLKYQYRLQLDLLWKSLKQ